MNLALAAVPFHLLPVTDQDVNQFIFEISEQIRARYVMNGHELMHIQGVFQLAASPLNCHSDGR